MKLETRRLGTVEFDAAWDLQRKLADTVTPDAGYLLLLEHPSVITLGRNGDPANVLRPDGIPVKRIDRGGDVTWHGPGQLIGYPLVDVRFFGIKRFVRALERSLIELLRGFGIRSGRRKGCVGVWTGRGKIASIGLRVRRGVTTHGFALNVSNDLEPFSRIHPCGQPGCPMTSMEVELGREVDVDEASDRFRLRLGDRMLTL